MPTDLTQLSARLSTLGHPVWLSPAGDVLLVHGDCLEILPELEAGSVDCVVADPPYAIPVGAAFVRTGGRIVDDGAGGFNEGDTWGWVDKFDCLIPGGNVAVFHRRGDDLPSGLVWWHRFYLVKDAPPPTPRPVFVSAIEECSIGRKPGRRRWFGTGYEPNYWRGLTPNRLNADHGHPSEKPLLPIKTLVRCLSDDGETVLDPFMGSGTTGIACLHTGRKFIGVEIDERYYTIARQRIERELARTPLFEPPPAVQQSMLDD